MKLTNLRRLYKTLIQNNENYFMFDFMKNNVNFRVLFDIYSSPFILYFLQKENDFRFKVDVRQGFIIDEFINNETYQHLCRVLRLKFNPNNPFSTKSFFEEFDSKIPQYVPRIKRERELLMFYNSEIEEAEKLYFDGIIEWRKINNGNNVTEKNLAKTRILYTELYDWCRRENISIRYTHIKKSDEKHLLNKIFNCLLI